jgi:hypothetical protein
MGQPACPLREGDKQNGHGADAPVAVEDSRLEDGQRTGALRSDNRTPLLPGIRVVLLISATTVRLLSRKLMLLGDVQEV